MTLSGVEGQVSTRRSQDLETSACAELSGFKLIPGALQRGRANKLE